MAESAVRAVRKCSPLRLPVGKYEQWKSFTFRFDPKLLNSIIENRNNFGSGEVHFNLTGTYMNDPFLPLPY